MHTRGMMLEGSVASTKIPCRRSLQAVLLVSLAAPGGYLSIFSYLSWELEACTPEG